MRNNVSPDAVVNLLTVFTPTNIKVFNFLSDHRMFLQQFDGTENHILVDFCYFIGDNFELLFEGSEDFTPNYEVHRFFNMAEDML